jgi:hypothetical protein
MLFHGYQIGIKKLKYKYTQEEITSNYMEKLNGENR